MKKTIFILAVLVFTIPVMADTVTITAKDIGDGWVEISYQVSGSNLVRAFALNINVDDGNIVDINDYFVGECNGLGQGYGIFLSNIVIEENGDVNDYGNPVSTGYPESEPGLDSNGITVEMGSLYEGVLGITNPNSPDVNGVLCTVLCDTIPTTLCVTVEGIARGGIVMEDVDNIPDVNLAGACVTLGCSCDGDISSGIGPGVTDDAVSLSDVTYLLQELSNYAPTYVAGPPIPAGYECADVSSGIGPGVTDDAISLSDVTYILQYLSGYGPTYVAPCLCKDGGETGNPIPCPE